MGYIKQFHGIRAIAVLLVILSHWLPRGIAGRFSFGAIGVDVFFVLSGFLITRILLVERSKFSTMPLAYSRFRSIKNFMVRRSLRIFPIYYFLLIFLVLSATQFPNPVAKDWNWYFFYLQNLRFYFNQVWPGGKLSHLWSLAVEEQFYLFWPLLILFVPEKWMLKMMVLSFFIGIASFYFFSMMQGREMAGVLTLTCMQAFASGGILAYFHITKGNEFHQLKYHFLIPGLISFAYLILGMNGVLPLLLDFRTILSIFMVGLISLILIYPKSFLLSNILGNPALVYLGKISYGIYLFHNFIPVLVNAFLHKLEKNNLGLTNLPYRNHLFDQGGLFYNICFCFLVIMSTFSFYILEQPVNKFKKYFE